MMHSIAYLNFNDIIYRAEKRETFDAATPQATVLDAAMVHPELMARSGAPACRQFCRRTLLLYLAYNSTARVV